MSDDDSIGSRRVPMVRIMRLPHAADLPPLIYDSAQAVGLDLVAAVPAPIIIAPGRHAAIPTGFAFALPPELEGQIRPRSGLALHFGVTVLNAPGTLDADYRGELHVILVNLGAEPFTVRRGMRIAQLTVAPVVRADIAEVAELDPTPRGSGGFGSTGGS